MRRDFSRLAGHHFDVLVCGGGIYGAWTAYDAALRGLKVALVDQGDWACATSSASSKLIHGGLRYLESLEFKLVRKTLSERQMLIKAAPHRVWPLRFGIPVFRNGRLGSVSLKIGLTLYDVLSGIRFTSPDLRHRYFNRASFAGLFPDLNPSGLLGGYTYFDALTDDARLVLELVDGAMTAGAVCLNYCRVTRYIEQDGRLCGAEIQDCSSGIADRVYASQLINATGQWTADSPEGSEWCRLSKGVHLILPRRFGEEALLLTAKSDGRVFFIIPWYGLTLLGSTDTDYKGNVDEVNVAEHDIEYLLTEANHYLKQNPWTKEDIIGSFAGLRVLRQSQKASPSSVSRDWELKTSKNGLMTSIGGKITSARQDASIIVDKICTNLGVDEPCRTSAMPFPWTPAENFRDWMHGMLQEAQNLGIDEECARCLLNRYGNNAPELFRLIRENRQWAERIDPDLPFITVELIFSAENEMAVHLEDLLRRRIPLLILSKLTPDDLRRFAETAAAALGWDESKINREIEFCRKKWISG